MACSAEKWVRMWTDDLLGPPPCATAEEGLQRNADGSLKWRTIPGRPYRTYRGCMSNPKWLAVLKRMVHKGIEVGLDGFNATHHYESLCHCQYCSDYARRYLGTRLTAEEIQGIFGIADLEEVSDVFTASSGCPEDLAARLQLVLAQGSDLKRKESFDEVFIEYGRSLKPDLLLAQWNHKIRFPTARRALSAAAGVVGEGGGLHLVQPGAVQGSQLTRSGLPR